MIDKPTFNEFCKESKVGDGMDAVRKRMNKKSHKKRNYGHAPGETGAGSGTSASEGLRFVKPIIQEIFNSATPGIGNDYRMSVPSYEEDAEEIEKKDQAAAIFRALYQRKDLTREDIIAEIEKRTGVTNSTAVSYYQRIAKEMGVAGQERDEMEDPMGQLGAEAPDDMNSDIEEMPEDDMEDDTPEEGEEPVIRTVDGAHLIKKEQGEDGKFEELWSYNVGKNIKDALKVRRDILAGTDIGENKTKSEDGEQSYTLWTVGNAQIMHIKGLAN